MKFTKEVSIGLAQVDIFTIFWMSVAWFVLVPLGTQEAA